MIRTGKPGRPRKEISPKYLKNILRPGRNIPSTTIAHVLGISRHTVSKYSKLHDIKRPSFTLMPDAVLDKLVKGFKIKHPSTGLSYLRGHFTLHNIRIQKVRLRESVKRVDGVNNEIRTHATITRREYQSARPNALWHIDGHHKLILWGIVIHGMSDGYDRTVILLNKPATVNLLIKNSQIPAMEPGTSNSAKVVLDLFLRAIKKYGCPSRVRGDRGGENIDLSTFMIMYRGPNRASFMWGS